MTARSAAGLCRLALLLALLAAQGSCRDPPDNFNHNVFKRSINDSDNLKSATVQEDNEQVSATEDSISANVNDKNAGEVLGEDKNSTFLSGLGGLESALAVARAAADAEQLADQLLPANSSDRDTTEADSSSQRTGVYSDQNPFQSPQDPKTEPERRAQAPIELSYNMFNNDRVHSNTYDPQHLNSYNQHLKQNLYNYNTKGNTYPYISPSFLQGLNRIPVQNIQQPTLIASLSSANSGFDPRIPLLTNLNSYPKYSQVLKDVIESPKASFSRKFIPISEMIYLKNIPGAENLVTCLREGEFYEVKTPSKDCLVCACLRGRWGVQPVCASCAGCVGRTPLAGPGQPAPTHAPRLQPPFTLPSDQPELLEVIPQQEPEILSPGPEEACAPLPYAVPFEHPLNPCRVCICQKRNLIQNQVFVSCMEDPQCVKPLEMPTLPESSGIPAPIPTPHCEKFPNNVEFPHPTEPCHVCYCKEYTTSFGIPEKQIFCTADQLCLQVLSRINTQPIFSAPGPASLTKPQQGLLDLNGVPLGQITKEPYPSELVPSLEPDSYIFPLQSKPSLPGTPIVGETLVLSPNKPKFSHALQGPEYIPEHLSPDLTHWSPSNPSEKPHKAISEYTPGLQPGLLAEIEIIKEDEPAEFPILQTKTPLHGFLPLPSDLPQPHEKVSAPPGLQLDALPWPPLTIPVLPKQEQGPLLGPPPHQSCQPYPANTPFQHPWDECRVCVCQHFSSPGHVSVEVNCYTKASCCAVPKMFMSAPESDRLISMSEPQVIQANPTQLQILDTMCELKPFGTEFVSARDACMACACQVIGQTVVPVCRSICHSNTALASSVRITFIEPKCRLQPPDTPFLVDCSVCMCQVVFTFVIAKCTQQPNCVKKQELNSQTSDILIQALANKETGNNGHSLISSVPIYQTETVLPILANGHYASNINVVGQPHVSNIYPYGQKQLNLNGFQQGPNFDSAADVLSTLSLYNQNYPINMVKGSSGFMQDTILKNTESYKPFLLQPTAPPSVLYSSTGMQLPLNTDSAEAFVESINHPYQKISQTPYNGLYQRIRHGPEFPLDANSINYPLNNYDYVTQQPSNLQQSYLLNYADPMQRNYLRAQAATESTDLDHLSLKETTYPPLNWPLDLRQLDASALPSIEALPPAFIHNSYSYLPQKTTPYPLGQSVWDSTTLPFDQGDSNARALLQVLADARAGGAVVTRSGRGQCQYAGDVYHRACQACYCFADDGDAGDIYSMCLGNPCH